MIEPTKGTQDDFDEMKKELDIDRLKLDEDLQRQPVFFEMVCERAAWANKVLDDANLNLEVVRATADATIREKLGKDKTEPQVKALLAKDATVLKAENTVIQAQHDKLSWQNMRSAFEMRSQSMQDMVKLIASGYAAYTRKQ